MSQPFLGEGKGSLGELSIEPAAQESGALPNPTSEPEGALLVQAPQVASLEPAIDTIGLTMLRLLDRASQDSGTFDLAHTLSTAMQAQKRAHRRQIGLMLLDVGHMAAVFKDHQFSLRYASGDDFGGLHRAGTIMAPRQHQHWL